MREVVEQLSGAIRKALEEKTTLRIRGGGSKDFYGAALNGELLDTTPYAGIVSYEPTELVLTARAGTPLSEIEEALQAKGQMLAFEPPYFGSSATLGGCIAAGLSGPRRAYAGAVRDFVLGVRMLNGKGEDLKFGGQVMKNVAGYDVSRLMAGALGTLGVLLEVSLKVLPRPREELTLRFEMPQGKAIETMNQWAAKPFPISGTCHAGNMLSVRLSGPASALAAATKKLGGQSFGDEKNFWNQVREQTLDFFKGDSPLWRLSVKSTSPPLDLPGEQLLEWNAALRWVRGKLDAKAAREAAHKAGGHATLFRGGDKRQGVFHPLQPGIHRIHQRLKQAFDPAGIFNPGRMYEF
jgi:glycolate oxidase FAD binding subunit